MESIEKIIETVKAESRDAHEYRRRMRVIYSNEREKLTAMHGQDPNVLKHAIRVGALGDECGVCYILGKDHPKDPDERERVLRALLDAGARLRVGGNRITTRVDSMEALHLLADAIGEPMKAISWGYVFLDDREAFEYIEDFGLSSEYNAWVADKLEEIEAITNRDNDPIEVFIDDPHLMFMASRGLAFDPSGKLPNEPVRPIARGLEVRTLAVTGLLSQDEIDQRRSKNRAMQ